MKKIFRNTLASFLAGGMLLGAGVNASAEPVNPVDTVTQVELALLGPDRSPRAPQRAVKAPVQRTEVRRTETTVTPPAPPVKPFVYERRDFKTLTDAPQNLQGTEFFCYQRGNVFHSLDEDRIHMWTPEGRFVVNSAGAMGADREFMRPEFGQRMGVWANSRIQDQTPRATVTSMVDRIKELTNGYWTEPEETHIAGIPVTMATGVDDFANYQYEIIAWERYGNKYAMATRVPYNTRYNARRNAELAWIVSHMHPSTWSE